MMTIKSCYHGLGQGAFPAMLCPAHATPSADRLYLKSHPRHWIVGLFLVGLNSLCYWKCTPGASKRGVASQG